MKLIFYKITNMVNIGAFYIIKCLVKLKTYKTSKLSTKKKDINDKITYIFHSLVIIIYDIIVIVKTYAKT